MSNNIFLNTRNMIYKALSTLDSVQGNTNKVVVLCYHAIDINARFSTKYSEFKKQIEHISKTHKAISISDLAKRIQKNDLSENYFVVTFDDGYKSVMKASKFLKRNKISATLSLISNIDNAKNTQPDKFLSKEDLIKLKSDGWEFASHSSTHRVLTELNNKELETELSTSKKTFKIIAYPLGRYNEKVIKLAKKIGYKVGLTMNDDLITSKTDLFRIPRIGVDATHTLNDFKNIYSPSVVLFRKMLKSSSLGHLFINI